MSSFGCILRDQENIFTKDKDIIYFLLAINLLETPKICHKCSCKIILLCENDNFIDKYSWNCSHNHTFSVRKNSPFEENSIPLKIFVNLVFFWTIGSDMAKCVEFLEIDNTMGEDVMGIINHVCHCALIRDPIMVGGSGVVVIAKLLRVQYYIPVYRDQDKHRYVRFKEVPCFLFFLLDFYQEKPFVHLSIMHSNDTENVLANIYRYTVPGTIIHIEEDHIFHRRQYEKIKYGTGNRTPCRVFSSLTTKDLIVLGEFITQNVSKNTNMDSYTKCQMYTYIEHVMYRYKSAAKRPLPRTLFEDFLIEYHSQFCNVANKYLNKLNENEI